MKKSLYVIFSTFLLISIMLLSDTAHADMSTHDVEFLSDGSYFETIIYSDFDDSMHTIKSNSKTETKSKVTYYKNAKGDIQWYVKVTGTFTYGNGSSKCISSTPSAKSYNELWKIKSVDGSRSKNSCTANATAVRYYAGTPNETLKKSVTLKCSPTGVFS